MRFWLETPCEELSREWLLDEHRSIHAYVGGMIKNPEKWAKHKLIGPMDAFVMHLRHEEEIEEMSKRGYKHVTPYTKEQCAQIEAWRMDKHLNPGTMLNKKNESLVVEEMRKLQEEYLRKKVEGI